MRRLDPAGGAGCADSTRLRAQDAPARPGWGRRMRRLDPAGGAGCAHSTSPAGGVDLEVRLDGAHVDGVLAPAYAAGEVELVQLAELVAVEGDPEPRVC